MKQQDREMYMLSPETGAHGEEAGIEALTEIHLALKYKGMSPSVPILFLLCLKWIHIYP